ncbi:hypothetical protein KVP09_10700 [Alcaligenaceae bacterium CGII-47]|nr:hypothetical protein [Alcaligenaceae bacterium CGII-47]
MSIDKLADRLALFLHTTKDSPVEGTALEACKPALDSPTRLAQFSIPVDEPQGAGQNTNTYAGISRFQSL